MHATEHSRTAEFMAFFRALETARPRHRRLFDDPLAAGFLPASLRRLAFMARIPSFGWLLARFIDRRWPGARTSGVARTRLIDEVLDRALANGFDQLVLLGAGFDSRAYRLPAAARAHVVEVDHPNTSRMKQQRIKTLLGQVPPHVTFAAIDFSRQHLDEALRSTDVDLERPVFFLWEGVTQYLSAEAVDETFRFVATAAPGSKLLFTYVHRGVLDGQFSGTGSLNRTLCNAAEPWIFGFDPAELPAFLAQCGLCLVSDLGAADYRALCPDRYLNQVKGYEFYRIAIAEVRRNRAG